MSNPKRSSLVRWLKRIGAGLLVLLVAVTVTGAAYEMWSRHRTAGEFPPPGVLVDIGGRRIHLDCRGTGAPTVVFEAGLDIYGSLSWSSIQDEVARTTRACSYDRAGIMWSDRSSGPRNGVAVARDLHHALQAADEKGPYVLVGHSLGGPYAMTFAKQFGSDVAGVVFVDASHPDQEQRIKEVLGHSVEPPTAPLKVLAALRWSGLPRLAAPKISHANAPAQANSAMAAYLPTSMPAMLDELTAIDETFTEAGTLHSLGDRPLVVLTAAAPFQAADLEALKLTSEQGKELQAAWFELQDEEATWSSRSRHLSFDDAHHYIQFERPDAVVAAIHGVVIDLRAERGDTLVPSTSGID